MTLLDRKKNQKIIEFWNDNVWNTKYPELLNSMKGPEGCDVLAWKKGRAVLSLTLNMAGIGQGGVKDRLQSECKRNEKWQGTGNLIVN